MLALTNSGTGGGCTSTGGGTPAEASDGGGCGSATESPVLFMLLGGSNT